MNYHWYKASDGTEWTNKAHMDRYEEERQLAKELTPLMNKPMELASWILENFERSSEMYEIMTIPVLSTGHLPSGDALRELGVTYAKYPYGFFVYMDEGIDEPWFVAVREWVNNRVGSGWVRFDCGADTVPDLRVFDWSQP